MFNIFKKSKILILADTPGWIVDRITDEMIKNMSFQFSFTKRFYSKISTDELIEIGNKSDLIHYQNWDWIYHKERRDEIKTPIITSIRSFRYPEYIKQMNNMNFHVINPLLQKEFPESIYIPDGIFEFKRKKFVVGFAGRPDEYKGYFLIKKACKELGVEFKPALTLKPSEMADYYNSIDLYVCASINEGFSAPAMECLSLNKPVITTDVGIPSLLNVTKIDRSVEGIKAGILKYYTQPMVKEYSWKIICKRMADLYKDKIFNIN